MYYSLGSIPYISNNTKTRAWAWVFSCFFFQIIRACLVYMFFVLFANVIETSPLLQTRFYCISSYLYLSCFLCIFHGILTKLHECDHLHTWWHCHHHHHNYHLYKIRQTISLYESIFLSQQLPIAINLWEILVSQVKLQVSLTWVLGQ